MIATRVHPRRTRLVVTGAACALLALTACSSSSGGTPSATLSTSAATSKPAGGAAQIVIKDFLFSPASLTVAPGTVVTVKNEDQTPHTATATGSTAFDTGTIAGGKTATFKAPATAGTYDYICNIHQYMKGKLTVR
ncbi:cupredoxin domain-containing protein [Streptomyces sp. H10-C2]|uniref:cupredoxin domain-containing protein n=1 Tax=unclassified Streptomyces TaxID=2593676 RepID=UPI0024BAD619|nr:MULTISPECIES: cupredoxin domain-containing protein [unclassified Streptomyces]MDJ0347236.1 cupredoxin domain-containing protein [Streptomyces sp. PH10-H1]MDJ0375471.1 cupredoxin domain-containing protein [Streptomyces sp. H10-C2]